jgi:pyruvate dehydrogenase E2 component (dihydrolipoamide acetyltransferase)
MSTIDVRVPDIGDFHDIPVIEVLVKPGDAVAIDDSLVTLESDKATMDVPSPTAGVVQALHVNAGDRVSAGSNVLTLDTGAADARSPAAAAATAPKTQRVDTPPATTSPPPSPVRDVPAPRGEKGRADAPGEGSSPTPPAGATIEVRVPDIGDFADVPVIEVFVKPGDIVKADDSLVTLESDKATMDVPSPIAGVVEGVRVSVGERVSEGTPIVSLKTVETGPEPASRAAAEAGTPAPAVATPSQTPAPSASAAPQAPPTGDAASVSPTTAEGRGVHASPTVRKFARELGADLTQVAGSGPNGRIIASDVQAYVKRALATGAAPARGAAAGALPSSLPWPTPDFSKFGAVETTPLGRIRKLSGANLARNWVTIPHVTQFDEADVTDLEAFRVALNRENEKAGLKITMLAFLIKASAGALRRFPDFNASLDAAGENLTRKQYFNVGFAADTPSGLVVPVVKGVDRKGVAQIARDTAELSAKARDGKLSPADMQGGCFSISSLGGIGGTAFTPIVNAPEVAILGVSKTTLKPVWNGSAFAPRLMLPLSLSYDHRVVDGAAAARFTAYIASVLADFRRVLL